MGGAQRNALSGSYEFRRRTNSESSARGRHNRRRASSFRRREHNLNVIELVDEHENTRRDVLATTSHASVLNALTEQYNRLLVS